MNEYSKQKSIIQHLAIIMDGNARWAEAHGLQKSEGHKNGAETIRKLLPIIMELNIPYLTLYAFSSENWRRSNEETSFLLNLLNYYLQKEVDALHKNGIRLKVIGKFHRLNQSTQKSIYQAIEKTNDNNKMTLCIAFSYGGRLEIIDACQKIINSGTQEISEDSFRNYLYDPDMPDVDLLIRTSGTFRVSNFLLWQTAYAELHFSTKYWPDFGKEDIIAALDDYSQRKRNFGS